MLLIWGYDTISRHVLPTMQAMRTQESSYNVEYEPRIASSRGMGWLRLVGSLKSWFSFAEYSLFYRALLQKRPIILRSLLIVATPYQNSSTVTLPDALTQLGFTVVFQSRG